MVAEATQIITPKAPGVVESAQTINSTVWKKIAENAWAFYKPGVGVDPDTGLPYAAGVNFKAFTDWDLGIYIQATVDASKLGLIKKDGNWGFNDRINKVLTFCETRELNNASYPYWFYQAADGKIFHQNSDVENYTADVADTGRLLVALNNLRTYDSSVANRVNNLVFNVYGNRSDYEGLVEAVKGDCTASKSVYTYYVAYGFACFWPDQMQNATSIILDNIYASGNVTVNGVLLPKASLTSDVLLALLFETSPNDRLTDLDRKSTRLNSSH
jgi:hypothetical protein